MAPGEIFWIFFYNCGNQNTDGSYDGEILPCRAQNTIWDEKFSASLFRTERAEIVIFSKCRAGMVLGTIMYMNHVSPKCW